MSNILTPEQIENWRTVLLGIVGPYALIMPVDDIQRYRDRMQEIAIKLESNKPMSELEMEFTVLLERNKMKHHPKLIHDEFTYLTYQDAQKVIDRLKLTEFKIAVNPEGRFELVTKSSLDNLIRLGYKL